MKHKFLPWALGLFALSLAVVSCGGGGGGGSSSGSDNSGSNGSGSNPAPTSTDVGYWQNTSDGVQLQIAVSGTNGSAYLCALTSPLVAGIPPLLEGWYQISSQDCIASSDVVSGACGNEVSNLSYSFNANSPNTLAVSGTFQGTSGTIDFTRIDAISSDCINFPGNSATLPAEASWPVSWIE
jgi:hypothetical protein